VVSDVPWTDATGLFEVRGEEIVDDGLVFGRRLRRDDRAARIVGGPRLGGRSVLGKQKRKQQQPDGGGHPLFAHFPRRPGIYNPLFSKTNKSIR